MINLSHLPQLQHTSIQEQLPQHSSHVHMLPGCKLRGCPYRCERRDLCLCFTVIGCSFVAINVPAVWVWGQNNCQNNTLQKMKTVMLLCTS
jgi:hypothetical protein